MGVIPENPDSNSVSTGKTSAEIREDELHANTTYTCTISNISALGPNAELAFSDQFRQRKRAKRHHKTAEKRDGETRSMVQNSTQGSAGQYSKGGSSMAPSGLVQNGKKTKIQCKGNLQKVEKVEN